MTKQHWIWTRHEICNTCTMCCIAHMWRMKIWQRCRCPLDMTACLAMLITVVIIITSNSNRRQLSGVWTNWTFNIYSNELTQIDGYVWEARTGILVHALLAHSRKKNCPAQSCVLRFTNTKLFCRLFVVQMTTVSRCHSTVGCMWYALLQRRRHRVSAITRQHTICSVPIYQAHCGADINTPGIQHLSAHVQMNNNINAVGYFTTETFPSLIKDYY